MGELAALLELLHDAHSNLRSFEGEYRDWSCPRPGRQLIVDELAAGGKPQLRWRGSGPWPGERTTTRRIWLQLPNRLRVELFRDGTLIRFAVRDHLRWWRWDEVEGTSMGYTTPDSGGVMSVPPMLSPPLLHPARLLAGLRLAPAGVGLRAGRDVLCATARPREPSPDRADQADLSYELEFDTQHGTLLRHAVIEDGICVQVTEAREVVYGRACRSEHFVFVAPAPRPAGSAGPHRSRTAERATGQRPRRRDRYQAGPDDEALGGTLWLTGLPAAGKTTLAFLVVRELRRHKRAACALDGDVVRAGLSQDLGLTRADRAEQSRRVAHVAALIAQAGGVAIVALVSPYAADRRRARSIHDELGLPFCEVWVDAPVAVCQQRDPKGLYAAARAGEIEGLTGFDAPYEKPEAPELRVSSHGEDPHVLARRIAALIVPD